MQEEVKEMDSKGQGASGLSRGQETRPRLSPTLSVDKTQALWNECLADVIMRLVSSTSS